MTRLRVFASCCRRPSGPTQIAPRLCCDRGPARRFSGTAGAHGNWRRTLDEHAKTARAMQRSIKENLTRVE